MSDPAVSVTLTDTEFSIGGIQQFLDRARGIDEMPADALVTVKQTDDNPKQWTLTASTEYRSHYTNVD